MMLCTEILGQQFVTLLELDEHDCSFQQDGATCHTASETINILGNFFGDRFISKNIWPLRSLNLTPPDFFNVGSLEGKSL
jgi:hypothetical protein